MLVNEVPKKSQMWQFFKENGFVLEPPQKVGLYHHHCCGFGYGRILTILSDQSRNKEIICRNGCLMDVWSLYECDGYVIVMWCVSNACVIDGWCICDKWVMRVLCVMCYGCVMGVLCVWSVCEDEGMIREGWGLMGGCFGVRWMMGWIDRKGELLKVLSWLRNWWGWVWGSRGAHEICFTLMKAMFKHYIKRHCTVKIFFKTNCTQIGFCATRGCFIHLRIQLIFRSCVNNYQQIMARVPVLLCVPRARVPQFCLSVPRSYIKFFFTFQGLRSRALVFQTLHRVPPQKFFSHS